MSTTEPVKVLDWPAPIMLAHHLETWHRFPLHLIEGATPEERRMWHEAEHRNRSAPTSGPRHAGHLSHLHPKR